MGTKLTGSLTQQYSGAVALDSGYLTTPICKGLQDRNIRSMCVRNSKNCPTELRMDGELAKETRSLIKDVGFSSI